MDTPVAFLVFNRPEVTRRVFARIREARPSRLFVVCDGPRPGRPDDPAQVAAVRAIIDQGIDWPCEVVRDYSPVNLGCRIRVRSGISRVFEQVEEAIILEDDCLPDPSFFGFCASLLKRYRHDDRILHIGGTNLAAGQIRSGDSYRYSHHAWIWGWATWRRAWTLADHDMATWEQRQPALRRTFISAWERQYWLSTWEQFRRDPVAANTWDFPWMYTVRSLGGFAIVPTNNLIENLGFGGDSTHTGPNSTRLHRPATLAAPDHAPSEVVVHPYHDELITRAYAGDRFDFLANLRSRFRVTFRH